MKKTLLTVFPFLFVVMAYSQQFGLKGGLNVATIGGDAQAASPRTSLHIGLFMKILISEKTAIMPEIVYSPQGYTLSSSSVSANYDYVNVPLMFNFYPVKKLFIQAGPQLGILVTGEWTDGTTSQNVFRQLKSSDFSLGLGAGGEFEKILLNIRYNWGLSSTSKSSAYLPNNVLQASIGYKF